MTMRTRTQALADAAQVRGLDEDEEETITSEEQTNRDVVGVDQLDPVPLARRAKKPRTPRAKKTG